MTCRRDQDTDRDLIRATEWLRAVALAPMAAAQLNGMPTQPRGWATWQGAVLEHRRRLSPFQLNRRGGLREPTGSGFHPFLPSNQTGKRHRVHFPLSPQKSTRVGEEYQAVVPEFLGQAGSEASGDRDREEPLKLWPVSPSVLSRVGESATGPETSSTSRRRHAGTSGGSQANSTLPGEEAEALFFTSLLKDPMDGWTREEFKAFR
eukprot:CAMPEP_0198237738 /NCGR_PEP_ID=MMETSP1446-20131203/3534_1 /TAXON_ID=1461542 ORGANISM="Unidentified sp, Strain CCMP2111" /NCGR_SAMPLE_ID=MMETSP1446 /ASSEMBLY_ACC=CAM_ASM_001112 /LENGTH=205 /DNA_ID=CAMNT_0043919985 /DNA_START=207 /DNA_END=821 /DNA_ORIENTATION=-